MFDRAAVHTISIHVFNVAFLFCVYIYTCVYSILHQFEPLYNLAHGNHPKKNKHILHNQKIAMAGLDKQQKKQRTRRKVPVAVKKKVPPSSTGFSSMSSQWLDCVKWENGSWAMKIRIYVSWGWNTTQLCGDYFINHEISGCGRFFDRGSSDLPPEVGWWWRFSWYAKVECPMPHFPPTPTNSRPY